MGGSVKINIQKWVLYTNFVYFLRISGEIRLNLMIATANEAFKLKISEDEKLNNFSVK